MRENECLRNSTDAQPPLKKPKAPCLLGVLLQLLDRPLPLVWSLLHFSRGMAKTGGEKRRG